MLISSKLDPGAVIVHEIERGALNPVTVVVVDGVLFHEIQRSPIQTDRDLMIVVREQRRPPAVDPQHVEVAFAPPFV